MRFDAQIEAAISSIGEVSKPQLRISLSSLAPDSFVLGPEQYMEQFLPEKVFNVSGLLLGRGLLPSRTFRPSAAEIHPTSRCELRCRHCSYSRRNTGREDISVPAMHDVLTDLKALSVGSLIFSGGGDPLSWGSGDIRESIRRTPTSHCSIATNGLGLANQLDKESLHGLSIVQININGFDEESFMETTGKDLFFAFRENVLWLFANRDKQMTQVTAKIVANRHNYRNMDSYLRFCVRLGFDVVIIKLAQNFEEGQDVELEEDQKNELRSILTRAASIDCFPAHVDAIATADNAREIALPDKCWAVELGLYVLVRSNGDVFPCVVSPFTRENRIGNVYNHALSEIWASDAHQQLKERLHQDMRGGKCKLNACRHLRYNYAIQDVLNSTVRTREHPSPSNEPTLL